MELNRVIEILEKHQEWRRDKNVPALTQMQSPVEIGTAIDYALIELKKLRVADVSICACGSTKYYVEQYKDVVKYYCESCHEQISKH